MVTTDYETINGTRYLVTREDGVIVRQIAADVIAEVTSPEDTRSKLLLAAVIDKVFRDGQTMTALERDRVIVACLALLRRIAF